MVELPAVGAAGSTLRLQTFAELLKGQKTGKAHTMDQPCTITF